MKELVGQRFGMLKVETLSYIGEYGRMWLCLCNCGKYTEASSYSLTSGRKKSCGCLRTRLFDGTPRKPKKKKLHKPLTDCVMWRAERKDCDALIELLCEKNGICPFYKPFDSL